MTFVNPAHLCQLFIYVEDLERSKTFYEQAFGWRTVPADLHDMVVLDVPSDCPYGIALLPRQKMSAAGQTVGQASSSLKAVFAVDDPESVVDQCHRWGGSLTLGPIDHSGYGRVWDVQDPDGVIWGLFKKKDLSSPSAEKNQQP